MTFTWTKPRRRREPDERYNRAQRKTKEQPEAPLTGYIQEKDATQGEERASRALSKREDVKYFIFRDVPVGSEMAPGSKELDFYIVTDHGNYMMQIDEDKWHDTDKDAQSDAAVNQSMHGRARPVVRKKSTDFDTQEDADRAIEEVLE